MRHAERLTHASPARASAWRRCRLLVVALVFLGGVVTSPLSASTADHTKFEELEGPFETGQEVTEACLSCHTEAAAQLMQTPHWTWEYEDPVKGEPLGKKTMLNAFCIGHQSNEAFCAACHAGYGWEDDSFDFTAERNVDCLVCHSAEYYVKPFGLAGHPAYERTEYPPDSGKFYEPTDLVAAARSVGVSSREACGSCHFYGGGGDGVKHGDLDSSLVDPSEALDVHMASDGLNFSCAECHETRDHKVPGSRLSMTASDAHGPIMRGRKDDRNPASCQACHGEQPHDGDLLHSERLNHHAHTLACQTCHIPTFARGGVPTRMAWDWSQATQLDADGNPFKLKNDQGHLTYDSRKGRFEPQENVVPDYQWFDGSVDYIQPDATVTPGETFYVNRFRGTPGSADARIWPVKNFSGRQPYDTENGNLVVMQVGIPNDTSLWFNFDFAKAIQAGMAATDRPFSGQFDFVDTRMTWPITHMVAPAEDALACADCHRPGGRLDEVPGIWLPGRDSNPWVDRIGFGLAGLMLLGSAAHAGTRLITRKRRKGATHD